MAALAALLVVLTLIAQPATAAPPEAATLRSWHAWAVGALEEPPDDIRPWPELGEQLGTLIDERRSEEAGLPPLSPDEGLRAAARAHAIDMLRRDFMAHEGPDGLSVDQRTSLLARQFVGIAGENLADHRGLGLEQLQSQAGPLALKIVDGWMQSPGHRENILRPDYSHAAFGTFVAGERLVVVHVFGARRAELADPVAFQQATGGSLDLGMAEAGASHYAFRAPGQAVEDLVLLELESDEIVVEPGLFQLMIMFPGEQEGRFDVADGPWIDVR